MSSQEIVYEGEREFLAKLGWHVAASVLRGAYGVW
jgi:hypothetical protein